MTKSVKCEIIDCCIACNDQNWDSHAKIDPKTIYSCTFVVEI